MTELERLSEHEPALTPADIEGRRAPKAGVRPLQVAVEQVDHTWRLEAACAGKPIQWFFPAWWNDPRVYRQAVALCVRCPVRADCLADSIRCDEFSDFDGIRGGLTPGERRAYMRDRGKVGRPKDFHHYREAQHGTQSGYNAHRRKGETPCDDCRHAHSRAVKLRKKATA